MDLETRRTSLNDSTHRRLLADLIKENKSVVTPLPVEFPESTVIESGKLPSWEERRRIRLARGTAIATVKTVIMSPSVANSDMASPGLTRSLVAIAREDREEAAMDQPRPVSSNANLPVPMSAKSLSGETTVPRTDSMFCFCDRGDMMLTLDRLGNLLTVILCKFYHTPGLKCTASPCRFVHEINRSPLNSPVVGSLRTRMSSDSTKESTCDDEDSMNAAVEIVEVFRMSGGGRGAGSEWAKAKFRSEPNMQLPLST